MKAASQVYLQQDKKAFFFLPESNGLCVCLCVQVRGYEKVVLETRELSTSIDTSGNGQFFEETDCTAEQGCSDLFLGGGTGLQNVVCSPIFSSQSTLNSSFSLALRTSAITFFHQRSISSSKINTQFHSTTAFTPPALSRTHGNSKHIATGAIQASCSRW